MADEPAPKPAKKAAAKKAAPRNTSPRVGDQTATAARLSRTEHRRHTHAAVPRPKPMQRAPKTPPLPTHKPDLAALAIRRGVPSYTAWAMTVEELTDKLKEH